MLEAALEVSDLVLEGHDLVSRGWRVLRDVIGVLVRRVLALLLEVDDVLAQLLDRLLRDMVGRLLIKEKLDELVGGKAKVYSHCC